MPWHEKQQERPLTTDVATPLGRHVADPNCAPTVQATVQGASSLGKSQFQVETVKASNPSRRCCRMLHSKQSIGGKAEVRYAQHREAPTHESLEQIPSELFFPVPPLRQY